jgi:hypothetical protein
LKKGFGPLLLALWIPAGCNPAGSSPGDEPAQPRTISFQGKVDPAFVGNWTATKGGSGLQLGKDGHATILTSTPTPGGLSHGKLDGSWLVQGGNLLLKYKVTKQPEVTIQYKTVLSGNTLTLLTAGARLKTVYTRK